MFTVYKDPDSGSDSPIKPTKTNKEITSRRRSLSADPLKPKQSDRSTISAPSSPTKRQLSAVDTPKAQDHHSNKENWDPVLKLYSTDRQSKKYRSMSASLMIQGDRIPLADITPLFQSRLEEARLDQLRHETRPLNGRENEVKPVGKENQVKLIGKQEAAEKKVAKREGMFKLSDKTNTVDTKIGENNKQPKTKSARFLTAKSLYSNKTNPEGEDSNEKSISNTKPPSTKPVSTTASSIPRPKKTTKRTGILMMR